jgi:hypothetical protein
MLPLLIGTFLGRNCVERFIMTTYARAICCTKSLNVETVSTVPTMEIKVWKVLFTTFVLLKYRKKRKMDEPMIAVATGYGS